MDLRDIEILMGGFEPIKTGYYKLKEQNNALAFDLQIAATDLLEVKEQRDLLLEVLKDYLQVENGYHGSMPVFLRPITSKAKAIIKKCSPLT